MPRNIGHRQLLQKAEKTSQNYIIELTIALRTDLVNVKIIQSIAL